MLLFFSRREERQNERERERIRRCWHSEEKKLVARTKKRRGRQRERERESEREEKKASDVRSLITLPRPLDIHVSKPRQVCLLCARNICRTRRGATSNERHSSNDKRKMLYADIRTGNCRYWRVKVNHCEHRRFFVIENITRRVEVYSFLLCMLLTTHRGRT